MNRHVPKGIRDVWDSYEWLLKDKLEQIDHMARRMYSDMVQTRNAKPDEIIAFMQQEFARLWREVADEQNEKGASA